MKTVLFFSTRSVSLAMLLAVTLVWIAGGQAISQATVIDFEDMPSGTFVTTQYGARGVLFYGDTIITDDLTPGNQALISTDTAEFEPGPLVIDFTSPQSRVSLSGAAYQQSTEGVVQAYDQMGALVAQDGPKPVTPNVADTRFTISAPTAEIVHVVVKMGAESTFEVIDDLEFEGEPPAPVSTEPPVVEIIAPQDGVELDTDRVTVRGVVTGEGLYPTARLKINYGLRPGSSAPLSQLPVTLIPAGATSEFTSTFFVIPGPYEITAYAENIGALTGSDVVRFTNIPAAIQARYMAEGGESAFGTLLYSSRDGSCLLAVYEEGLIALAGDTTYIVTGGIVDKWASLPGESTFLKQPGCPTAEERSAPGGGRAQDFSGGRIYTGLATGAHYVPAVFVQALEQMGGEEANGVPIADPSSSIGVMQTWLFQQFTRPDKPQLLPSTLEIRGSPPRLWVERQGGDQGNLYSGIPPLATLPTIWENYPCDTFLGPCTITPGTSDPPIENAGGEYCLGTTWPKIAVIQPREWVPVVDDYTLTPILGIVRTSRMAGTDNPLTHECDIAQSFPENVGDLAFWRSDWIILVRPFHPYRNLFAENTSLVELEFEYCWAQYFFAGVPEWGEPHSGDLLFASGRWIIDCGHDPFRSEIHPPAVLAYMRTGTVDQMPATAARIWVNGIYTGDPVEFDIYPPPRPSPDAVLNVRKPVDSQAALDVKVEYTIANNNHVRVRFSASERHVPVNIYGQVLWEYGRVYYGRWDVFWTPE